MLENNRNRKQLFLQLEEKSHVGTVSSQQQSERSQSFSKSQIISLNTNQIPKYPIQLPVTHIKFQNDPSDRRNSGSITSISRQSVEARHQNSQAQIISQLHSEYDSVMKGINDKEPARLERTVSELNKLFTKCLQLKIQVSKLAKEMKDKEKPTSKGKGDKKDKEDIYEHQEFQWMMVVMNVTLNLWKLLSESNHKLNKYTSSMQILKKTCNRLISILRISPSPSQSYFFLLPGKIKNKLILILILWAKEQLSQGNTEESLRICDICSFEVIHSQNASKGINKCLINKENKFKLHYLRMRIFRELSREREELQEIVICESLLAIMGPIKMAKNKNGKEEQFDSQLFERMPNENKVKTPSNHNLLSKLQARKKQILVTKRAESARKKESLHKSKFKQIRDSFQMQQKIDQKAEEVYHSKNRSLKRIKSMSNSTFHKQNEIVKQVTQKQNQMAFKTTCKANYLSLHTSPIAEKMGYEEERGEDETVSKFLNQKQRLRLADQSSLAHTKSLSAYKSRIEVGKANQENGNSKKIKDKFELTSKKLAKRPILSYNKNKEFQDVLLGLEAQMCNQPDNEGRVKQCYPAINHAGLLAERPQNRSTHLANMRSFEGQSKGFKESSNPLNEKKASSSELQSQNILTEIKSKSLSVLPQKVLQQCVDRIERQTIEKYIQRMAIIRRKKYYEQKQTQDVHSQDHDAEDSQGGILDSDESQQIVQLKVKESGTECKLYNKSDNEYIVEHSEPSLELSIKKQIFPGLGLCESIEVSIRKMRQYHESPSHRCKYYFIMRVSLKCDLGIFELVHRLPEGLMLPDRSILRNIKEKFDADLPSIRVKNSTLSSDGQFPEEQITERKIMRYLKNNIVLSNRGLGLHLKQINQLNDREEQMSPLAKRQEEDIFRRMCASNRIYLQNKTSLQFLFSDQNLYDVNLQALNLYRASNIKRSDPEKINKQKVNEDSPPDFSIMDKLKVLYIAIQKKCKKEKQQRNGSKGKSNKSTQKINKEQKSLQNGNNLKKEEPSLKIDNKNSKLASRKRNEKRKSFLKHNIQQDTVKQCGELSDGHKDSDFSMSFDGLLVPVVKYILMGQTSKPKHKLKTIIIKTKQSLDDPSIFSSEDESNDEAKDHHHQKRSSKTSKYGLLTPFMDDQSTVKVGKISINIYGHIIGKYFMGVDSRKNQNRKNSETFSIPEDVMLSIKYYLMIPSQNNIVPKPKEMAGQSSAYQLYNIIDRFYEKFEYSFMVRLISEEAESKRKNYMVKVNLYRVKKLYRPGLEKFYLLKFELYEKGARTQVNQLITTSYDINKHFNTSQFNLIHYLDSVETRTLDEPIKNRLINFSSNEITVKNEQIGTDNTPFHNRCSKCFNPNEQSINYENENPQPLTEVDWRKEVRSQAYSQSQLESQIQILSKIDLGQANFDEKRFEKNVRIKQKNQLSLFHAENSNLHSNFNRLSCPEAQFMQKIKSNQIKNILPSLESIFGSRSKESQKKWQDDCQLNNNFQVIREQRNSKTLVPFSIFRSGVKKICNCNSQSISRKEINFQKPSGNKIAVCLKRIAERIVIYKTLVHTKIGIQSFSTQNQEQVKQERIACYANKFRFSRNKNLNLAEEFLSPHLNCLEIMFQKTMKIHCDGKFAILTVLRIKHGSQFYFKIYLPESQKTMSFTLPFTVFEYFSREALEEIFSPYIDFNYNQFKLEIESQRSDFEKRGSSYKMLKSLRRNQEIQRLKELRYMVGKINEFFTETKHNGDRKSTMKVIWSRIFKHLQFQRRYFGTQMTDEDDLNERSSKSLLIAKLGQYEAFVKGFSVEEYIIVKNSGGQNECSVVKVEVSMGSKEDGLNFIQKNSHTNALKAQKRKSSKNRQRNFQFEIPKRNQSHKIYESEAKKQMVYISIIDSKTGEKMCYNYYLCELLHLIDYSSLTVKNKHGDNEEQYDNEAYKVESKQFKELILNYAVLFKVLNYIKNQYIIELQNSNLIYLPKLYKERRMKDELKANVDKILLCRNQRKGLANEKDKKVEQAVEQYNFNRILTDLLSCTLKISKVDSKNDQKELKSEKQEVKITFNTQIKNQKDNKLVFLVRKVVARKGYPICCIFLNKVDNNLKIYLSNSKKGRTREIEMPIGAHPMPFINLILQKNVNENDESQAEQNQEERDSNFVLSLRNRLRKYHHNMTLLAPI